MFNYRANTLREMSSSPDRQASVSDNPDAHLLSKSEVQKVHQEMVHGYDDVEDEFEQQITFPQSSICTTSRAHAVL